MIYEPLFELEKTGINIAYHTKKGRYSPTHWHSAIELIYVLNGTATISIEGKDHKLVAGEFIVVDSNRIHEAQCTRVSMMVVIHYSRASMQNYMTKIDEYRIYCSRQTLKKEKLNKYLEICSLLKRLPPLYVTRPPGYRLQSQAVAMEVLFELVNHFSVSTDPAGEDRAGRYCIPFLSEQGVFQPVFQAEYGSDVFSLCKSSEVDAYLS